MVGSAHTVAAFSNAHPIRGRKRNPTSASRARDTGGGGKASSNRLPPFEDVLNGYIAKWLPILGIKDWTVVLTVSSCPPNSEALETGWAAATITESHKREADIYVRPDIEYSAVDLEELIVHELLHVVYDDCGVDSVVQSLRRGLADMVAPVTRAFFDTLMAEAQELIVYRLSKVLVGVFGGEK